MIIQWNPVNTVTNVLTEWSFYPDRLKFHDLRAVLTNKPSIAFAFVEQLLMQISRTAIEKKILTISRQYKKHF